MVKPVAEIAKYEINNNQSLHIVKYGDDYFVRFDDKHAHRATGLLTHKDLSTAERFFDLVKDALNRR